MEDINFFQWIMLLMDQYLVDGIIKICTENGGEKTLCEGNEATVKGFFFFIGIVLTSIATSLRTMFSHNFVLDTENRLMDRDIVFRHRVNEKRPTEWFESYAGNSKTYGFIGRWVAAFIYLIPQLIYYLLIYYLFLLIMGEAAFIVVSIGFFALIMLFMGNSGTGYKEGSRGREGRAVVLDKELNWGLGRYIKINVVHAFLRYQETKRIEKEARKHLAGMDAKINNTLSNSKNR